MAQLLFRVMGPDNQVKFDELVDTLSRKYGYPEWVDDGQNGTIPNPEDRITWLRRTRREAIKADFIEQKKQDAREAVVITDPGLTG
ncbi:MAG: hypothetical protein NUV80_05140 [Candidatus Berkelbacteria bacterium]|nr:hypothetical protein [Candidatus Berkelbacteria bacterium]